MTTGGKAAARTRRYALHRRIEQCCVTECLNRGRTWDRLTHGSRELLLGAVLERDFTPDERSFWAEEFHVGDVLTQIHRVGSVKRRKRVRVA